MKQEYNIPQAKRRFSDLSEEYGCAFTGVTICGRVALEKEKYAQLEEELVRTKRERETYRVGFESLLGLLNRSFRQDLIIETFKQRMVEFPEIKSVYCLRKKNMLSFSVFMNEENWAVEDKIYEIYGELIDNFSEIVIRIRVLRLWGRKEDEILAVEGVRLLV